MLFDPNWQKPADIKLEPWQELLLKAADLLEEKGWVRGALKSEGRYCTLGALSMVAFGDPYSGRNIDDGPHAKALDAISNKITGDYLSTYSYSVKIEFDRGRIWRWNDRTNQTKESVVAMLRDVAKGN